MPNCCLQCVCACLYVCISGGSCDDAHSDGGNAGGGDGVAGGGRGGAVDSLSSLFPLHLHLPHQRLLTLLSPGSRTAVGTVTCSCVVQYSVRACLFPYTIFTHHLPTGGGKISPIIKIWCRSYLVIDNTEGQYALSSVCKWKIHLL